MEKEIKISKDKYYRGMIKIINCFLNMTDFEIDIITSMLVNNVSALNKTTRLVIRNTLNVSEHNFNNYIKKLKDKKVLYLTKDGLAIHPVITEAIEDKEVKISFNVIEPEYS